MTELKNRYWWLILVIAMVAVPFVLVESYSYYLYLTNLILIYIISALGLNIVVGYSGQLSLGHAAFFAVGAYVSAYLSINGISFWIVLPVACASAGLLGLMVGLPSLRLRGPYLALSTAAFAEVVMLIINNNETLGRSEGLGGIPKPSLAGLDFSSRITWYFTLIIFVGLMVYISWRLVESYIGRALIAIKVNETAARASGINTFYFKVFAFTISAVFAGLSGTLYAHYIGYVSPDTFTFTDSVAFLSMVVVGGLATQSGPIIGTILIVALPDILSFLAGYKIIFYGVVIVACVVFLPSGVASVGVKLVSFVGEKGKTNADFSARN